MGDVHRTSLHGQASLCQPLARPAVRSSREMMAMEEPSDDRIRQRAHELWEQGGRPEGRQDEFWYQAEQELREMDRLRELAEAPPPIILPG